MGIWRLGKIVYLYRHLKNCPHCWCPMHMLNRALLIWAWGYTPVVPRIDKGRNIISLRSARATRQDCIKKKKEIKMQTDKNKQQRHFWSKQNPVNIQEPQFTFLQLDLTSLCQFTLGAKGDSRHFSVLTKQGVLSLFTWVKRCLQVWL